MLDNVMVFEMTGGIVEMTPPLSVRGSLATEESVIPNAVPNPSAELTLSVSNVLRACPERSAGINSREGACEESCSFLG